MLTFDEAVSLIKNPIKKHEIEEGKIYESKLRIFTEVKSHNELKNEAGFKKYIQNLEKKLSHSKIKKITDFIAYPLPVVNVSNSILTELYKVFDARNSYFDIEIDSATNKQRIIPVINDLDIVEWVIEEGKEVLKNEPNKIVIIDKDELGNPYLIDIDSDRVIDFKVKDDAQLDYIIFIHSIIKREGLDEIRYCVYDDMNYNVIVSYNEKYSIELSVPHGLDYCPARFFVSDSLNSNCEFSRKNPIAKILSKLEEWQNFDTYKTYVDHYVPFPVLEAPEQRCSVENCQDGKIHSHDQWEENGIMKTRTIINDCPSCSNRELIGPGTVIKIPPKTDKDDPSEAGVFRMISNGVDNLNYIKEKLTYLEKDLFSKVVGLNEIISKEAVNDVQVKSNYDTRQNVLIEIKKQFDEVYIWIVKTASGLINNKAELKISANFGTEFYLLDEQDLQLRFENAKKIGLPESELDSIFRQLLDTKYKGNGNKIERSLMIKYLDPFPFYSVEQCLLLAEKNLISSEDLILKLELINFVDRFELENVPLNNFGTELNPYDRIKKIKETFKIYLNEKKTQQL